MDDHAEVFQSLADPTRLRLLNVLMQTGEICVCELVHALRLPQYGISRHLQKLVGAGLLQARRQGLRHGREGHSVPGPGHHDRLRRAVPGL
jgi:ArsR family transcriptional regulator